MKRHFKTLAMVMVCMAMALCVSCKKNNDKPSGGNTGGGNGGGTIAGHEYVDLGLPSGTLWATCNVGASKPEDYGSYFAWGETSTKSIYDYSNYKWWTEDGYITKYCNDGTCGDWDNKLVLESSDDVAHVKWGGSWRMPTRKDFDELMNNCKRVRSALKGVSGINITGPNGNSIFMPDGGYYSGYGGIHEEDWSGNYWSSSLFFDDPSCAWFFKTPHNKVIGTNRDTGMNVRPVSDR